MITRYPVPGSDEVLSAFPRYLAPGSPNPLTGGSLREGRVYISGNDNRTGRRGQYFEGVSEDVWEFQVGGYQICERWLKDRRGRVLSADDVTRHEEIVVAIAKTLVLMGEIESAIASWPVD